MNSRHPLATITIFAGQNIFGTEETDRDKKMEGNNETTDDEETDEDQITAPYKRYNLRLFVWGESFGPWQYSDASSHCYREKQDAV